MWRTPMWRSGPLQPHIFIRGPSADLIAEAIIGMVRFHHPKHSIAFSPPDGVTAEAFPMSALFNRWMSLRVYVHYR